MAEPISEPAALILASGLSERMGSPKALLMWNQSTTFLEKIVHEYLGAGCNPVIGIVTLPVFSQCKTLVNQPHVKIILNLHPEWGRMYSVRLGLEAVNDNPFCLLQNVDNPFINMNAIRKILASADAGRWCSPEYKGKGGHPVLLPKKIVGQILQEKNADMILRNVLDSYPKTVVAMEDDCILKNMNTPGEYEKFLMRNH